MQKEERVIACNCKALNSKLRCKWEINLDLEVVIILMTASFKYWSRISLARIAVFVGKN